MPYSMPENDHDILIEMRADFRSFRTQYAVDILAVKDGYTKQLTDHESRLQRQEKLTDQYPPEKMYADVEELKRVVTVTEPEKTLKQLQDLKGEVHDFVVRAGTARFIFAILGSIVGGLTFFILVQLLPFLRTLGIIH